MTIQPFGVQIHDELYGTVRISDDLLLSLIACPTFQRLKGVLQHGISAVKLANVCGGARVTRYSHSVGAALLIRRLGGSLEEQAAALLHDVSHTALSHVLDSTFGFVIHEELKMQYLGTTEIPDLISAAGFSATMVLDESKHSLLERDAPSLCADRLDYALRDSHAFGFLSLDEIRNQILPNIIAFQGEIVCKSVESALLLSRAYLKSDQFAWSNPTNAALYYLASETIREAFRCDQLTMESLWSSPTCDAFWEALRCSPHHTVQEKAAKVNRSLRVTEKRPRGEVNDTKWYSEQLELTLKPRTLDPHILYGTGIRRLTELDLAYKMEISDYRVSKKEPKMFWLSWPLDERHQTVV